MVLRPLRTTLLHVNHRLSSVQDMERSVLLGKLLLGNLRVELNLFTSWGIRSWCGTIKWCLVFLQWVQVRYHFRASGSKTRSLVHLTGFKLWLGGNLWAKLAFLSIQLQQQWLWAGHDQVTWTSAWRNATKSGEEAKVLSHRQQTHWLMGLKPLYYNKDVSVVLTTGELMQK